jgi:hypothetical protein
MSDVVADISMSLDGFVSGPDAGPGQGLGRGGEALHTWAMEGNSEVDQQARGAAPGGIRLFDGGEAIELEQVDVRVTPFATHLTYVPAGRRNR